jgi:glycosyltransferase involved in cell wall biosynthesis
MVAGTADGGTSLVTGLLGLAGLRTERCAGLTPFEDRLLGTLGGSWDRPPVLRDGWERSPALAEQRHLAPAAFRVAVCARTGAGEPVVWQDDRASLLLPFWREVLDRPLVVILSCTDPVTAAEWLEGRTGCRRALGVALWDRYQRSATESLRGLPVFVSHLHAAASDPATWAGDVCAFLRANGVDAVQPLAADVRALVKSFAGEGAEEPALSPATEAALAMLPAARGLLDTLDKLAGPHEAFDPPPPEEADGWVSELLEARSDAAAAWQGLVWAADALEQHAGDQLAATLGVPRRRGAGSGHPARSYPLSATEDRVAYSEWLEARGRPTRLPSREEHLASREPLVPATEQPAGAPRFSILVPVYKPPMWVLERCVASVFDQTEGSWELCLCDDASGEPALTEALAALAEIDPRVKVTTSPVNGGISAATNGALALATGEFVVFLDNDDELAAHALEAMSGAIAARPDADVLYSDEDKTNELGELFELACKPDFAPDTLLSCAYMCHLLVVRRALLEELGGLRPAFDGSQDYDLMLRATERAREVVHVPDVLYHWRMIAGSAAGDTSAKPWAYEAGHRALQDAMARRGEDAVVDANTVVPGVYHVRRRVTGDPLVSVIVPFKDEPALLTQCVESVCEAPGYDRFELVLVDNGSVMPETATLLDRLSEHPRVMLLEEPGPFNWSTINNDAATASNGDLLLFMNNDVEATTDGWLLPMVEHAQRPQVGAVGARLLYPNRTIQHAGVVVGMSDAAAHVLQDLPEDHPGYLTWAFMTRNVSAVTGACLMTPRARFEQLGGFAPDLPVAFNDIDYCLRLRAEGRLVVYTPLAELVHHESRTRGHTDDAVELPRFLERWAETIAAGDPYHNPNLSYWRPWCPLSSPEEDERWTRFLSSLERWRTR